jgi:hypothetical protein
MKTEQIPEDFCAWIKAPTFEIGSFEWRTSLEVALTSSVKTNQANRPVHWIRRSWKPSPVVGDRPV